MIDHVDAIRSHIEAVGKLHREQLGMLVTEEDLRQHLCHAFLSDDQLGFAAELKEGRGIGRAVHSEVSWFGADGGLSIRPDITLVHPRDLEIVEETGELIVSNSSKGARFDGPAVAIELKFARLGMSTTLKREVGADVEKMYWLVEKHANTYAFVVVANRVDEELVLAVPQHARLSFIYLRGGVPPTRR